MTEIDIVHSPISMLKHSLSPDSYRIEGADNETWDLRYVGNTFNMMVRFIEERAEIYPSNAQMEAIYHPEVVYIPPYDFRFNRIYTEPKDVIKLFPKRRGGIGKPIIHTKMPAIEYRSKYKSIIIGSSLLSSDQGVQISIDSLNPDEGNHVNERFFLNKIRQTAIRLKSSSSLMTKKYGPDATRIGVINIESHTLCGEVKNPVDFSTEAITQLDDVLNAVELGLDLREEFDL